MAYLFNGSSQSIDADGIASTIATGAISFAAWIKFTADFDSTDPVMVVCRLGDDPSDNDAGLMFGKFDTDTNDGKLYMRVLDGTTFQSNTPSKSSWTAGQWYHVCGTFSTAAGIQGYVDGSADGTGGTIASRGSTAATNFSIGASPNGASNRNFAGDIAEFAIWSVVLTASEVASLGKGFSPMLIKPQNLVFYTPLVRNLIDHRSGVSLTNVNTATVSVHPRVIYPNPVQMRRFTTAAAAAAAAGPWRSLLGVGL